LKKLFLFSGDRVQILAILSPQFGQGNDFLSVDECFVEFLRVKDVLDLTSIFFLKPADV
jgi:hypothetical protein